MTTTFSPSKYQEAIAAAFTDSKANLQIEAKAGSGKTTTLLQLLDLVNPTHHALFLAFNKSIAEELKTRAKRGFCTTFNSFGWSMLRSSGKWTKLNEDKVGNIFGYKVLEMDKKPHNKGLFFKNRKTVCKLVALLKSGYTTAPHLTINELDEIVEEIGDDIEVSQQICDWVNTCLKLSQEQVTVVDFDDQLYMALYLNCPLPYYDIVFVDEAQDLNGMQVELLRRYKKQGARIIAVGDSHQAIYAFRGAVADNMKAMATEFEMTQLPLSVSYRCPQAIVREARTLVPEIEWSETAEMGLVSTVEREELVGALKGEDFVLCRLNAPLIELALQLLKQKVPAVLVGRDFGASVKALCEKLFTSSDSRLDMIHKVDNWYHQKTQRREKQESNLSVQDRYIAISILLRESESLNQLLQTLSYLLEQRSGVRLMSIHKSKGLEANRVFILQPELLPHPNGLPQQEANLKYVAITRAKGELYYVTGTEADKDF